MDIAAIGSLLGGLGSLAGGASGLFGGDSAKAAKDLWGRQADRQEHWMKNQILWRVQDAYQSRIHPLAALGSNVTAAQTPSIAIGDSGSNVGSSLEAMGQGIHRAASAFMKEEDKHLLARRALELERGELENQILRFQVDQMRATGTPPAFPDTAGPTNRHYPPSSPVSVLPLGKVSELRGSQGDSNGLMTPYGFVAPKPPEMQHTYPGNVGAAAGVNPDVQWRRTSDGKGVYAMPAEGMQMDDFSSPGYFGWMVRNRLRPAVPYVGTVPKLPDNLLPKGAHGWIYSEDGAWYPTDSPYSKFHPFYVPKGGR